MNGNKLNFSLVLNKNNIGQMEITLHWKDFNHINNELTIIDPAHLMDKVTTSSNFN